MLERIKERFDYFAELDRKTGTKHHVLYIEPDYDALIWEEDTVIYGAIDDADTGFQFLDTPEAKEENDVVLGISRKESEDNIDEDNCEENPVEMAHTWLNDFFWTCLVPVMSDEISREELAEWFDWKKFHEEGIDIAKKIAAYLPDNCELWYTTPYEDCTSVFPDVTLIKEAK